RAGRNPREPRRSGAVGAALVRGGAAGRGGEGEARADEEAFEEARLTVLDHASWARGTRRGVASPADCALLKGLRQRDFFGSAGAGQNRRPFHSLASRSSSS